jgi:oxalate---CoA ligase
VFHDATTLDALCNQQEGWREWPLRASDGDLAMLVQITSECVVSHSIEIDVLVDRIEFESQVDFKLDITGAKAARTEIDWNSKKAGK